MANKDLNIKIGADINNLTRQLGKVERKMKRFARNLQSIGSDLTQSISLPILGIGGAALQAAGDFEKLENGLKAILGPTGDYRGELERLRKVAEAPGLGFEQAVRGSIRLQAVGFSADEARDSLSAFGKAVALTGGTAQELDSVVRQLAQINSKGRLLAEDINVILENAPGVALALQEAFGTSNIEAIRESGISAKEFTDTLTAAIQRSETFAAVQGGLGNAIENARIAVRFFLADLGKQINELFNVQEIVERLSTRLVGLADQFRALPVETKKTIIQVAAFAAALGPALLVVGKFANVLTIIPGQLRGLLGAINPTTLGLTILAAYLIDAYQNSEDFRRAVGNLLAELKRIPATIVSIGKAFSGAQDEADDFAAATERIRNFLAEITQALADLFGGINDLVSGNVSDGFRKLFAGLLDGTSIGVLAESLGFDIGDRLTKGIEKRVRGSEQALLEGGFLAGIAPRESNLSPFVAAPAPSATTGGGGGGGGGGSSIVEAGEKIQAQALSISDITTKIEGLIERQQTLTGVTVGFGEAALTVSEIIDNAAASVGSYRREIQELPEATKTAAERARDFLDNFTQLDFIVNTVNGGFENFFTTIANGGENAFKAFIDIVKKLVIQLVAALATAILLTTVFSAVFGLKAGTNFFKGILTGGRGTGLDGLLNQLIPGRAQGGIVPSGYPNDTFFARLSSQEAIIPLNRLDQLGFGGGGVITTRVSGSDLILVLDRARKENDRGI